MSDSLKRFRRIEKATIVFCLIIFIMGIVEEIIAYLGIHIITIEDFRYFSLVLLQIQAGVSTIAVALIRERINSTCVNIVEIELYNSM